jgi:hypothetical protein
MSTWKIDAIGRPPNPDNQQWDNLTDLIHRLGDTFTMLLAGLFWTCVLTCVLLGFLAYRRRPREDDRGTSS